MLKKKKVSDNLGRDQEISPDELAKRYAALRRFLEDNWGYIGLDLPRVRQPGDVQSVLNQVKNAEWSPAFRDFPTGCLLRNGLETTWREVRGTRAKHKEATKAQGHLSLESHKVQQRAQDARNAFDAALSESKQQQPSKQDRRRLATIAKQLQVEELTNQAKELAASFRDAQLKRESLEELLTSQEAWLARSEIVGFVRDRKQRYRKTPDNFARVMAGLPLYDWLYSIRKCKPIPQIKTIRSTYWFQIFERLCAIVKRTKSANLSAIELKLKNELLKPDTDRNLQSYISPQWFYMTLAFADCRGKKLRPALVPYKIMAKFLDHCQGHSVAEFELAKYHQLIENSP